MMDTLFSITYGDVTAWPQELTTVHVTSLEDAKAMARTWIRVIPDDSDMYLRDIEAWDGGGVLDLCNQDDDTFIFLASRVATVTPDHGHFQDYVREHDADPGS